MTVSRLFATGLCKRYGARQVVHDVDLSITQGEVVGLLGPNGAGKTTTFYMLAGIIKPTAGSVYLDDKELAAAPLHQRARLGMSYLPQESSVFHKLTVYQNLMIILEHTSLSRAEQYEKADNLLEQLRISRLAKQKAMYLSGGERRRLEIARALILEPRFMLLDEPFAGIDPIAVDEIKSLVHGLTAQNIGVLISDHNVRETLSICHRAYLVVEGRIILAGPPQEIIDDPKARQIYLGEDFKL